MSIKEIILGIKDFFKGVFMVDKEIIPLLAETTTDDKGNKTTKPIVKLVLVYLLFVFIIDIVSRITYYLLVREVLP